MPAKAGIQRQTGRAAAPGFRLSAALRPNDDLGELSRGRGLA